MIRGQRWSSCKHSLVKVVVRLYVAGDSRGRQARQGKGTDRQRGVLRRGRRAGWEREQRQESPSAEQPPISVSSRKYTHTHTLPLTDALCSRPRSTYTPHDLTNVATCSGECVCDEGGPDDRGWWSITSVTSVSPCVCVSV